VARGDEATAEFVRHYRLMIERTEDNPEELCRAFDEHPDLSPAIKRLGEIFVRFGRHRKTAQRRYVVQAHPEFRDAFKDFDERWRGPYNDLRNRMYDRALARFSEEFTRAHRLLIEQTGNDPSVIERATEIDPELEGWIDVLEEINDLLKRDLKFEPFLSRSPDEFHKTLADYRDRWADMLDRRKAEDIDLDSI
jgi:hypothetical protein